MSLASRLFAVITLALASVTGATCALAQTDDAALTERLRMIGARAYAGDGPGGAVVALRNGAVLIEDGFGYADLEWRAPLDEHTAMRLGSVSKPLTAIVVLRLAARGLIDLDAPLSDYVDDVSDTLGAPTIRQLLSHTSGLPDHFAHPDMLSIMRNPTTLRETAARMADAEPLFAPGASWAYSNFNYVLLALLIEEVTEREFVDVMHTELFDPLAMTESHFDDPGRVIPRRARGYDLDGEGPVNAIYVHPSHAHAAGALLSSAHDLGLWGAALGDATLLAPELWRDAFTSAQPADGSDPGYGLGFNIGTFAGESIIWHSGSTNGFNATFLFSDERELFVAVLSNGYYSPNPTTVARRMLAEMMGVEAPVFEARIFADDELMELQGAYRLDDGRMLQIHVQSGVRFAIGEGGWTELRYAGDDVVFTPDSLAHLRIRRDRSGAVAGLDYVSSRLETMSAQRISDNVSNARIAATLDVARAERLTGAYALSSGDLVVITLNADALFASVGATPPVRIYPASDDHLDFFAREQRLELTFDDDAQRVSVVMWGPPLEAVRR